MAELAARAAARQRREKKAAAKAKAKSRVRAALGVASAGGAAGGGEGAYGPDGELFALRHVAGAEALEAVAGGEEEEDGPAALAALIEGPAQGQRKRGMPGPGDDSDEEVESDDDELALERELDGMYEAYAARRGIPLKAGAQRRARARLGAPRELDQEGAPPAKRGRKDDDWDLKGDALAARSAADAAAAAAARNPLLVSLPGAARPSRAVDAWFANAAFADLEADLAGPAPTAPEDTDDEGAPVAPKRKRVPAPADDSDDDAEDIRTAARAAAAGWAAAGRKGRAAEEEGGEFTVVPAAAAAQAAAASSDEDGSDSEDRRLDETLDDSAKAEIRAMGRLFLQRKSRDALVEGGYHKWVTGGGDDMPDWFAEDESRHCRPALPITAAAAAAERAHLRALDARPIKKVAEAKARKKKRAYARLEAARSAANAIADQEDTPLASRMRQIERVYAKSARKGGKGGKEGSKAKSKTGATGKKLDPRMRADKREVNAKSKKAAAKKGGKGKSKGGKR